MTYTKSAAALALVLLSLVILGQNPAYAANVSFSLNLYGGLNYLTGGDLNTGLQGLNDYDGKYFWFYGLSHVGGEFEPVHLGMNFGGDLILQITPALGVGIGAGYLQAKSESAITYGPVSAGDETTAKLSAVPLRLTVYCSVPMGSFLSVRFHGGLAYYVAKMSYDFRSHAASYWTLFRASADGGGLGFHGGLGLEFNVSPVVSFFLEGQGRYANLSGFDGTLDVTGSGGPYPGQGGIVYYYVESFGVLGSYSAIFPMNSRPTGPGISQVREAKIDFSGFSVVAGVLFRF